MTNDLMLSEYSRKGYAVISVKYGMMGRIDRPDWREFMALQHAPWDAAHEGMAWVRGLGHGAADHYRRVHSKDVITVDNATSLAPNSCFATYDYIAVDGDPAPEKRCLALREKVATDPDMWRLGFLDAVAYLKARATRHLEDPEYDGEDFAHNIVEFEPYRFMGTK